MCLHTLSFFKDIVFKLAVMELCREIINYILIYHTVVWGSKYYSIDFIAFLSLLDG